MGRGVLGQLSTHLKDVKMGGREEGMKGRVGEGEGGE